MRNDELKHHGILGMKWGKRNGPPYPLNPSDRSAAEKRLARDADKSKKKEMRNAVKNRRQLSDDELNKRIRRLESEKKLKDLTTAEINSGRGFVKDFVSTNGKKIAGTMVVGAAMYAGKAFCTKHFDIKEAANYVFQKPKVK